MSEKCIKCAGLGTNIVHEKLADGSEPYLCTGCGGTGKTPTPPVKTLDGPEDENVWKADYKKLPHSEDESPALFGPNGDLYFSCLQDAQYAASECNEAFKMGEGLGFYRGVKVRGEISQNSAPSDAEGLVGVLEKVKEGGYHHKNCGGYDACDCAEEFAEKALATYRARGGEKERDFTPQEALEEARRRFGSDAVIAIRVVGPLVDPKKWILECVARPFAELQNQVSGVSFREAFAKMDSIRPRGKG